jgi:hypothetical protein
MNLDLVLQPGNGRCRALCKHTRSTPASKPLSLPFLSFTLVPGPQSHPNIALEENKQLIPPPPTPVPSPSPGLYLPALLSPGLLWLVSDSMLQPDATQVKRPRGRVSVSCRD